MNYLTFLITVPLTLFTLLFAVSNTDEVPFYFFPGEAITVPGYVLGLGMLGLGFLAGVIFVSILAQRVRFKYWQEKAKAGRLEKELDRLHAEKISAAAK